MGGTDEVSSFEAPAGNDVLVRDEALTEQLAAFPEQHPVIYFRFPESVHANLAEHPGWWEAILEFIGSRKPATPAVVWVPNNDVR